MHDLAPMTALGSSDHRVDIISGVTLTENSAQAHASVAARLGKEDACLKHLTDLMSGAIPAPAKIVTHDVMSAFWIGPNQWMVSAPFESHEDLAQQLKARFQDSASITEQTDAWVCFEMRGSEVNAVRQLCANIDIEQMQPGDAVRSVIHYMGVYVIRTASDALSILGGRSSAASLHHALVTAMRAAL